MTRLEVSLPDSVPAAEARVYLAIKLYEIGRLSCGQAAEVAGLTKSAFMAELSAHGIDLLDQSDDELMDDLRHA